jgi:hypothetical protein
MSVDLICPPVRPRAQRNPDTYAGPAVSCDHRQYLYDLTNYGGKWLVFAR